VDGKAATENTLPPMKPIEVPTLVIWGEKDTALLTGNLNGLDEQVKHLTVRRIPDGTHWVIHEKTAEVVKDMREFFGGKVGVSCRPSVSLAKPLHRWRAFRGAQQLLLKGCGRFSRLPRCSNTSP